MHYKSFPLTALLATTLITSGCNGSSPSDSSEQLLKVAVVCTSNVLMDESYNQITWESCKKYAELHQDVTVDYYIPPDVSDEERINTIDMAIADALYL